MAPPRSGPQLVNETRGVTLAVHVRVRRDWWGQLVGWIGRRVIPPDTVLGLPHCRQIHTWGVRVPLDVVFCDRAGVVLLVVVALPPRKVSALAKDAFIVWEAAGNTLAPHVGVGDCLTLRLPQDIQDTQKAPPLPPGR